ncbi:TetR/AcrR family transcriptional regulator [Actinomycetes bacterium M1A6_2h]
MAYRRTPAVQDRLAASRARIVDAATSLVSEYGYAGCSVSAVAARADIGTGTVYRHFASKGELFAEVFRTACTREVDAVRAARTAGSAESVVASMLVFAHRALRAPTMAYALLVEPVDPLVEAERLAFRRAFRDSLAESIDVAIEAGSIPAQDSAVTAACIVGAIAEALVVPLAHHVSSDAVTDSLATFVRRAIGVNHEERP